MTCRLHTYRYVGWAAAGGLASLTVEAGSRSRWAPPSCNVCSATCLFGNELGHWQGDLGHLLNTLKLSSSLFVIVWYIIQRALRSLSVHCFDRIMEVPTSEKDNIVASLFPSDGPNGLLPVKTFGDGNCFFRAVSKLQYGDVAAESMATFGN